MNTVIYLKFNGFKIEKLYAVTKHEILNVYGDAKFESKLKSGIKKGVYTVSRVVIERDLVDETKEFYLYDFNRKSYIILDKLNTQRCVAEVTDWVETVLYMARDSNIYDSLTVININSNNFIISKPNDSQMYYHEYCLERIAKYFKTFNRFSLYTL